MILQQHKIVFAGSMGAGKTEAIRSLSEIPVLATEAFNTDSHSHNKLETTVGIDYGEITLEADIKIGLYGTPGQSRFDFIWSIICEGAIGVVILIDHSLTNSLNELENYLNNFKEHNENIVIGITHTDENPDQPLHIYREWLSKNQYKHPLFFIDARVPDDILLLIEALITTLEVKY
ncbi:GTP-binding protein [Acinetobacter sp. MD2]|uniref:GTP-binding protein n=1 Tax=Acinetobacter sp. MD2 TaxID=2600066 RepID=UPI002D1F4E59|nr:ATP/GTP-binding protein [Acinetobacter sp. MD2]MEB3768282.1 ATP/GTP-binding protein [Acinetobacter sp. MD2]